MQLICHGLKEKDFAVDFVHHRISIGSESSNGIVVTGTGISGHHAIFAESDHELYIQDFQSLNGTYLNRQKVEEIQLLSPGDVIQIGVQQIRFEKSPDRDSFKLNFLSSILAEDNSEVATAMTVLAESNVQALLQSGKTITLNGETTTQIIVTSTKDIFIEGREVGKYIIEKRIGKGGMGEIYLARHKTLGTYRALKVLPKEFQEDNAKFFDRFIREAKLAAEIKHPNVVGVMDVESDATFGFSYIVMEYIDGGSLRRILKSSSHLSEEQAVIITEAIASALRVAEEHKIVHRDIKPDNIMFTRQGEIKLADLGIAKNDDEDNDLTKTNVMIGTPAYLSPEQVQNAKDVDSRADIYSLGATFYEMLTGQHPYPGKTTYEILHKLFSDPVPDPRKIVPEISEAAATVVMKMLAKDAGDRFQSASELLEVLEKTFPPHTPSETAELVKKAISGNCENNATFRSGITMTYFAKKKFEKRTYAVLAGLLSVLIMVIGAAFFMRTQQMSNEIEQSKNTPVIIERAVKKTDSASTAEPMMPSFSELQYELTVKTSPDAEIRMTSASGILSVYSADSEGNLKIAPLKKGVYHIRISSPNHIPVSKKINVERNQNLVLTLAKDVKLLTVHARPGSQISISGVENSEQVLRIPENGALDIPGLLADTLLIRAELAGFEPFEQTLLLKQNQKLNIVQRKIKNSLMVKSVPFAHVDLQKDSRTVYSGESDSSGTCSISNIDFGQYTLMISCSGYHPQKLPCDMSRNQDVMVSLKKISYDLELLSNPDAKIILLKENQEYGIYYTPENGKMKLKNLLPGSYSVIVEKNGFFSDKYDFDFNGNKTVKCILSKKMPEKSPVLQNLRQTARTFSAKGMLKINLVASDMLKKHISEHGLQLNVGSHDWITVKHFPHLVKTEAGKVRVQFKGAGLQPIPDESIWVETNKNNEFAVIPYALPSQAEFISNKPVNFYLMGGTRFEKEQIFSIETFKEYTATAVFDSRKITKHFISTKPGGKIVVEFFFSEIVHPYQKQYEVALKVFKEEKYKEALPLLLKAAEQKHPDAAFLAAEIYDRGLGMWFSDSKKARELYFKAADFGNAKAAFLVAEAIRRDSYDGSAEQMLNYYLIAVKAKNARAAYQVSLFYKDGYKSIAADENQALTFLKQAADWGAPDAMFDLGMRYEKGIGIPANSKSALHWIDKAAAAGHEKARRYKENLQ